MMSNNILSNNWLKKKIQQSKEHQAKAFEHINDVIVTQRNGRKITLLDGDQLVEFMSCSYLGLDQDKRVVAAAINHIQQCGVNFAVARTRMRVKSFAVLEDLLNTIFHGRCITFTSLHITHLGMLPLLASGEMPSYPIANNGVLFIMDKIAHASIQINRALMQQFGEVIIINVNDIEALRQQCCHASNTQRTPIIVADSVGSMGGLLPIKPIFQLAEQYNGYVYLDDAHGISVYGNHGSGYVLDELEFFHPRLMLAISLSKAFGANGAAIVVHTQHDEAMVRRFCNPYLFSNPSPLAIVDSAIAAAHIHLSDEIYQLQQQLQKHIMLFDSQISRTPLESLIINYQTSSPIRGILIGDEFNAIDITTQLRQCGFALTAAMYPTVAKGSSILRITLGADHHSDDIQYLCSHLLRIIIPYLY